MQDAKGIKSKIGKRSRRKGKSFEREMAKYFTKWTGVKWETTRNSGRTDLKGDIYPVDYPDFPMVVECKHRKAYTVHAMILPLITFRKAMSELLAKWFYSTPKESLLFIIVKNETGLWVTIRQKIQFGDKFNVEPGMAFTDGCFKWYELRNLHTDDFAGMQFGRMVESSSGS